ncbi:hypothetical protein HFP89_15535 [Wenzhouxiangella sp. XN79A]|uniref:hypothetical protein n=1 Tax=Wenzhouxiangella sp. XN79A TaxID=2724193 RepID=UPI00144A5470|nr:hypothetical protein [Wenzhouxiangella sp. XN79A]NKI36583.1 hypothetical protein [Wenzhouxiangella sp. XN79A]
MTAPGPPGSASEAVDRGHGPLIVVHDLVPAAYRVAGHAAPVRASWTRLQRIKLVVLAVVLAMLCGAVEPTLAARPLLFWSLILAWAYLSNLADRAWLARHEARLEKLPSGRPRPGQARSRFRAAVLAVVLTGFGAVLVAFGPGAAEMLHPAVLWPLALAALTGAVQQAGVAFGHAPTRDPAGPDPVQPPR